MRTTSIFFCTVMAAIACGCSASGTRPNDMSAPRHQTAAAQEDRAAAEARSKYDPNACYESCWTDFSNPTSQYLSEAKRHEEIAAKHRAASRALGDAEVRACVGVLPRDRDNSPFSHREDIVSVRPLQLNDKPPSVGAIVVFRAVPGMTVESLQRIVDCHIARNSVVGNDMPEMAQCPLVPKGATAKVTRTSEGFEVAIRGDDAGEVWRRASALSMR